MGYLLKESAPEQLSHAIRLVAKGQQSLDSAISPGVLDSLFYTSS